MWQLGQSVSISELKQRFLAENTINGEVRHGARSHLHYFNLYLEEVGLTDSSNAEFVLNLDAVLQDVEESCCGWNRQDINCARSAVRRIRDTLLKGAAAVPRTEFKNFSDAYGYYGEIAMVHGWLGTQDAGKGAGNPLRPNARYLEKITGVASRIAVNLMVGIPVILDEHWRSGFQRLEDLCHAPSGTFQAFIHFTSPLPEIAPSKRGAREPYYASLNELSPAVQDELRRMLAEKGDPHEGTCNTTTTKHYLQRMLAFAGFLRRPVVEGNAWASGVGMDISQLDSLLLEFCRKTTLDAYRAFRIARSFPSEAEYLANRDDPKTQKRINNEVVGLYEFAASLIKPAAEDGGHKGGFVFREHYRLISHVADELPKEKTDPRTGDVTVFPNPRHAWLYWCTDAYNDLLGWARKHRNKTQKTRLSSDLLGPVLDELPDPRIVCADLLNAGEARLKDFDPRVQPCRWASVLRILVFFYIICAVPVRLKQFGLMTGSNFFKVPGHGIYRLFIPKEQFKNGGFDSTKDLIYDFPDTLTPLFDLYFDVAWRVLNASKEAFKGWNVMNGYTPDGEPIPLLNDPRFVAMKGFCPDDRVFGLRTREGVEPATGAALCERIQYSLQQDCFRATGRWVAAKYGARAWNPHAFRHIIATGIIKTGGTYEDAARILWDTVAMVRREYVHLKNCEHLRLVAEANRAVLDHMRKALRRA